MKPQVLIIGASGLLGSAWVRRTRVNFSIACSINQRQLSHDYLRSFKIKLHDIEDVRDKLKLIAPQLVINCAAMTDVDECEKDPSRAYLSNVILARNLATACFERNIKFVQISTDHVFSGKDGNYSEEDTPEPKNVYAETKLLGEREVLSECPGTLVVRSNFYGWGPRYRKSFSDRIICALRAGEEIHLFDDAFFSPVSVDFLIESVMTLVKLNASGLYHISCDERISKYEFGVLLTEVFFLDSELIQRSLLATRTDLTPRPQDLSLCNLKIKKALGKVSFSLRSQLNELKEQESLQ